MTLSPPTRIARHAYRNGGFGTNTAWLARTAGGYLFGNGFYDPIFFASPVEAKAAFRSFVAQVAA